MREIDDLLKRKQELGARVEEFHLPGQHDQTTHGGGRGMRVGRLTDKELVEADGQLVKLKELAGGRSVAKVALGRTKDGRQIVRKTGISREHEDKEILVSKLGIALGAPVPNVTRRRGGGIVMERAPGEAQGKWGQTPFRRILQPLRREEIRDSLRARGAKELGILDYLSNNTDRRAANFLLDRRKSGNEVFGIDHTSSFWPQGRLQKKYPLSPFADRYVRGKQFSADEIRTIRKQVRSVRPYFARRKRLDWYSQVQRRIDSMERGYDLGADEAGNPRNPGTQIAAENVETFQLKRDGRVNFYQLDFEGELGEEIGFFIVVGGKITKTSGEFINDTLLHFENGDEALEAYEDWSNGWIASKMV